MKAPRSTSLTTIEAHKAKCLEVLSPMGFVDNNCGERPGTIFHGAANFTFDTNKHDLSKLIPMLAESCREWGANHLRHELAGLLQLTPAEED